MVFIFCVFYICGLIKFRVFVSLISFFKIWGSLARAWVGAKIVDSRKNSKGPRPKVVLDGVKERVGPHVWRQNLAFCPRGTSKRLIFMDATGSRRNCEAHKIKDSIKWV